MKLIRTLMKYLKLFDNSIDFGLIQQSILKTIIEFNEIYQMLV